MVVSTDIVGEVTRIGETSFESQTFPYSFSLLQTKCPQNATVLRCQRKEKRKEGHVLGSGIIGLSPCEISLLSFPFDATALQSVPSVSEDL